MAAHPPVRDRACPTRLCGRSDTGDGQGTAGLWRARGGERGVTGNFRPERSKCSRNAVERPPEAISQFVDIEVLIGCPSVKLFLRFLLGLLILAILFGAIWVIAKYRASPPPTGETYRLVPEWPRLPESLVLGQVSGVDVASNGDVYVFHRAERFWGGEEIKLEFIASPTVLVLNSETGEAIAQWGEGTFVMPHGLTVDDQDNVWLTDVGLHQV